MRKSGDSLQGGESYEKFEVGFIPLILCSLEITKVRAGIQSCGENHAFPTPWWDFAFYQQAREPKSGPKFPTSKQAPRIVWIRRK